MIDREKLLPDLGRLLRALEEDLRESVDGDPAIAGRLRGEWECAGKARRTAEPWETWRDGHLTQAAAAWVLATVFVRFLEDNELLDHPHLSGPGSRVGHARDHQTLYFRRHPERSDREYLEETFLEVGALPAMAGLLGDTRNLLGSVPVTADGAKKLIEFWRRVDPETGEVAHDFTDPEWNTRFLGDLYQDLSEAARKRYALLQTPDFVVEFILDRTLTPAIGEFGYREVKLIDPACGSGHFLLAAFDRLFARWTKDEPGTIPGELARRALGQIHGVDLNPYAVSIAKFRLVLAALKACGTRRLASAPGFPLNLAAGDSLLFGRRPKDIRGHQLPLYERELPDHVGSAEDADALRRILGATYHVVVGNPPYITPKDAALNRAYRERFGSCYMKYSLAVPFTERFFDLAVAPPHGEMAPAGFVAMITADSFMKREFGKELIEEYIPRWDLTHVIHTSGAYIPGHGTPTVILFARHRAPVDPKVRVVMCIRGEPSTPADPAKGQVWTAILDQVDRPGSRSEFISVGDLERETLGKHPWSLGGGGAAELKERLDESSHRALECAIESIGFMAITGEDEAFVGPRGWWDRQGIPAFGFGIGEDVRDWSVAPTSTVACMYSADSGQVELVSDRELDSLKRRLWPLRENLRQRLMFGKTPAESGLQWFEYRFLARERLAARLLITYGEVATHNHFVLDRGGKVFKQTAPVIKLPAGAGEDEHLGLLGLLNSSVACFWLKQTCHNKGSTVDQHGARQRTDPYEDFFQFNGTKLLMFPLPETQPQELGRTIDSLSQRLAASMPACLLAVAVPTPDVLAEAGATSDATRQRMISLQEDLDWECYRLYGLLDESVLLPADRTPPVRLGERAFEIVMARKMAAGELETRWFERHRSTPVTEIPSHWPEEYREIVRRRIEVIESDPDIALIEQPEYKRRWNSEPWEEQEERALRDWLLDRLEAPGYWPEARLTTCARLADAARADADFMQVAALYRGRPDFDMTALVAELVQAEAVPYLAALRYTPSGRDKREAWDRTWDLQRAEDAIDARTALPQDDPKKLTEEDAKALKAREVGKIPVPPKYQNGDFRKGTYWRLRGKLDVPKERFVSFPFAERDADPTTVIGWAGWDHLARAKALAAYLIERREQDGWEADRLLPLLAGLAELLPWLRQWHNEYDPHYGTGLGDYFGQFLDGQLRELGLTAEELGRWAPPENAGGGKRGRKRKR